MNFFPTRLALGSAFCNRKQETNQLRQNIENVNPVLIMSPRRYGKTSLAINTFNKIVWTYVHMDFYKALSEEDIEKILLRGVGQLLGSLETTPKKLLKLASDFFSSMHVKVVLETAGLALDFSRRKQSPAETILESLEKLHDLAIKKNKKVILFMDEFQTIGEITDNYSIEASLREAAQKSTNVSYVYSGSNRHLLQEMFTDKKRPFYKLCNMIVLDRISETDYMGYINDAAKHRWRKPLTEAIINRIFALTERHSYYINKLCSMLWLGDYPTVDHVNDIWGGFVAENKSQIERELELLSLNQRRLLISVAENEPVKELYGRDFIQQMNLSSGSISRALSPLLEKDYLYLDKNNSYRILDPLVRDVLI